MNLQYFEALPEFYLNDIFTEPKLHPEHEGWYYQSKTWPKDGLKTMLFWNPSFPKFAIEAVETSKDSFTYELNIIAFWKSTIHWLESNRPFVSNDIEQVKQEIQRRNNL